MDDNSMVPRDALDGAQSVIEQLQATNARLEKSVTDAVASMSRAHRNHGRLQGVTLTLMRYARHKKDCEVGLGPNRPCTCGLDSALKAARDLTA